MNAWRGGGGSFPHVYATLSLFRIQQFVVATVAAACYYKVQCVYNKKRTDWDKRTLTLAQLRRLIRKKCIVYLI